MEVSRLRLQSCWVSLEHTRARLWVVLRVRVRAALWFCYFSVLTSVSALPWICYHGDTFSTCYKMSLLSRVVKTLVLSSGAPSAFDVRPYPFLSRQKFSWYWVSDEGAHGGTALPPGAGALAGTRAFVDRVQNGVGLGSEHSGGHCQGVRRALYSWSAELGPWAVRPSPASIYSADLLPRVCTRNRGPVEG